MFILPSFMLATMSPIETRIPSRVRSAWLQPRRWLLGGLIAVGIVTGGCGREPLNSPYPAEELGRNILYSSFAERPKHLDPARSYSSNEYAIIGQVYEPPLQYSFLKRPYTLEPLTAQSMPDPAYFDEQNRRLPADADADQIAYSVYEIHIRQGIMYQPHPAFVQDVAGHYPYQHLSEKQLEGMTAPGDLPQQASREVTAEDYVYEIKRLASPRLNSPVLSIMGDYIVGLQHFSRQLAKIAKERSDPSAFLDLRKYPLAGVQVVDRYTYRIKVKGKYPQLLYWLAMPFFSPIPWEVDRFYHQPGLTERNITLDWFPVGSGAYMLTMNNPNQRMVLERNPNYHDDYYPETGSAEDKASGMLDDAGKRLPFIDKVVYSLEKETIPYWTKFLQGYYDVSGISSDSFDQAIQFSGEGDPTLTPAMRAHNIHLNTDVAPSTYYLGFNMMDPVVGGESEEARKLRRAISIAVDYDEFVSIFRNGRGIAAQGPIPPGIFGYQKGETGINHYVYQWKNGEPKRRSIEEARKLLAEAGYPGGRDAKTGKPLLINLDVPGGGPEDKSTFDWYRKQFAKLNLQLQVRSTDYNRFQEKMRNGTEQLFIWGWNADYPDPENFLFLLYGPNAKVEHGGENAGNYDNPQFNKLFMQMKNMANGPERRQLIEKMLEIVRRDAPWVWGFHPREFVLHHQWYYNAKPNQMAHNALKYKRIDPQLRAQKRLEWNQADFTPLWVGLALLVLLVMPAVIIYRRKERAPAIESGQAAVGNG